MAIFLPDVNILLALAWPSHTHHQMAHSWLTGLGNDQWATCAITEVGFVRISSNERFVASAATPHRAIEMLQTMITDSRHLFWQSELPMCDPILMGRRSLRGHRQVTDAYLLGLCLLKGGRLITFDDGIPSLALSDAECAAVVLLKE